MPRENLVPEPGPWRLRPGVLQGANPTATTYPGEHPTGGVYDTMNTVNSIFDPDNDGNWSIPYIFPFAP
jgi:hypothetical protein